MTAVHLTALLAPVRRTSCRCHWQRLLLLLSLKYLKLLLLLLPLLQSQCLGLIHCCQHIVFVDFAASL
jgi:hypothetical protein